MNFKRIMALILVIVLVLGIIFMAAGCAKNEPEANQPTVQVVEGVTHTVPKGFAEKDAVLLTGGEGFDKVLEGAVGFEQAFEPIEYYDENGECAGFYVIDENGWVAQWQDFEGKTHKLPEEDQFEVGLDKMVPKAFDLAGTLELKFYLYVKDGVAVACYRYFILSDAADQAKAIQALQVLSVTEIEKVTDTVLLNVMEATDIQDIFALSGEEETAENFVAHQQKNFGVTGKLPETAGTTETTAATTEAATEAAGETTEATGETTEATGETTEATGETTEATGETTEATGETTEATGENTEATGETTEATAETTAE